MSKFILWYLCIKFIVFDTIIHEKLKLNCIILVTRILKKVYFLKVNKIKSKIKVIKVTKKVTCIQRYSDDTMTYLV